MREQEVMYTYWSDINLKHATVRVSHKPDREWTPKAYKEREIPIPSNLAESLTTWKNKAKKGCNLVFPTAGCNPKLNFLDDLKSVAERAKLDKDNFWLRKFRATFATRCLWAGVDLRTVQQWLGHSDMESTVAAPAFWFIRSLSSFARRPLVLHMNANNGDGLRRNLTRPPHLAQHRIALDRVGPHGCALNRRCSRLEA